MRLADSASILALIIFGGSAGIEFEGGITKDTVGTSMDKRQKINKRERDRENFFC